VPGTEQNTGNCIENTAGLKDPTPLWEKISNNLLISGQKCYRKNTKQVRLGKVAQGLCMPAKCSGRATPLARQQVHFFSEFSLP
jgi:hypothetical protein